MNENLRAELLAMAEEDRQVRSKLAASGTLFDGYHPEMEAVHVRNAGRLESLMAEHGWPSRTLAGEDGADAAWLVVQHAISLPWFQRRCLQILQNAAGVGDIPPWQPAYLLDRILVFEGKLQVYGTQFDLDENLEMSPCPIEDADKVNSRRAAVGLDSIEARTRQVREQAKVERKEPRTDRSEFRRQYEEWLKRVGWRI